MRVSRNLLTVYRLWGISILRVAWDVTLKKIAIGRRFCNTLRSWQKTRIVENWKCILNANSNTYAAYSKSTRPGHQDGSTGHALITQKGEKGKNITYRIFVFEKAMRLHKLKASWILRTRCFATIVYCSGIELKRECTSLSDVGRSRRPQIVIDVQACWMTVKLKTDSRR